MRKFIFYAVLGCFADANAPAANLDAARLDVPSIGYNGLMKETAREYPFFTHRACPHFPCHEGVDADDFNCLFCHCPLYTLGPRCGGDFTYTSDGTKDCSGCALPHVGDAGTHMVMEHYDELRRMASNRP